MKMSILKIVDYIDITSALFIQLCNLKKLVNFQFDYLHLYFLDLILSLYIYKFPILTSCFFFFF